MGEIEDIDRTQIIIEEKIPTGAEHYELRTQVGGLTPPPVPENEAALLLSWYCITLRDVSKDDKAIGMGRIVGDGIRLYIVDMAVLPAYQKKGLGSKILSKLVQHVDIHAPKARLALEGDPPGMNLYHRHGFQLDSYSKPMLRRSVAQ